MAIAPHTERRPPAEVTCHLATAEMCSRLASHRLLAQRSFCGRSSFFEGWRHLSFVIKECSQAALVVYFLQVLN
jgi:hypothetical protein